MMKSRCVRRANNHYQTDVSSYRPHTGASHACKRYEPQMNAECETHIARMHASRVQKLDCIQLLTRGKLVIGHCVVALLLCHVLYTAIIYIFSV